MPSLELIKTIAEIAALLGAGLFFGYKAWTGYLRVNLTLAVQCERQARVDGQGDNLVVTLRLQKGPNGSLTLHDVQACIAYASIRKHLSFSGVERSSMQKRSNATERRKIDWSNVNPASPLLKLVPGEETHLSLAAIVPTDAVCHIEVAVLGRRTNGLPFGQWKASSVSLPKAS